MLETLRSMGLPHAIVTGKSCAAWKTTAREGELHDSLIHVREVGAWAELPSPAGLVAMRS